MDPLRAHGIGASDSFPQTPLSREIDECVLQAHTAILIPGNRVDHVDQVRHINFNTSLLAHFAHRRLADRLPQFLSSTRQAPGADARRLAALDQ